MSGRMDTNDPLTRSQSGLRLPRDKRPPPAPGRPMVEVPGCCGLFDRVPGSLFDECSGVGIERDGVTGRYGANNWDAWVHAAFAATPIRRTPAPPALSWWDRNWPGLLAALAATVLAVLAVVVLLG